MSAIDLLESQHRDMETLLDKIDLSTERQRLGLCRQLANVVAVHAAIEERHLSIMPAQQHVAVNRLIADLLHLRPGDRTFDARLRLLRQQIVRHIREEENVVFPAMRALLDGETLDALEHEMTATQEALESAR